MSTEDFVKDMKTRPVRREQTSLPGVIAINGGVPIKAGNDVIGSNSQALSDTLHLFVPTTDLLQRYHDALLWR